MYKEPKYRTILESTKEELNKLRNISLNDKYKPLFHIHPQHGLLNDPNGLAYYNGKYHVFYQWYPYDATHGMKHWAYVSSDDFVNWNREDVALIPIESYESHGAYSGNAIEVDGKLHMYYTGNIKYSAEDRYAYQNLAIMNKDGKITKYENNPIVSEIPKGYTGHVRDPKVFKIKDKYFMLLGVEPKGFDYQNIYNVVYAIGNMDLDNLTFEIDTMKELEKGFDFYAPQTFIKDSQIILFAWAGMGEVLYPTDKNKWAHCLTVPRKLNIKNNKLLQMPVDELIKLRYDETSGQNTIKNNINIIENNENVYELNINIKNIDSNKFGLELFSSQDEGVKLEFNKLGNIVTLDKSNFKKVFGVEYGTNRKEYINIDENTNIKVLADRSILEIFINDGEVVFTSRIFAKENSNQIRVYSDKIVEYEYTKFKLKQGIEL